MDLDYEIWDVFTDAPYSGNPLAVFAEAPDLTTAAMARIAGELNLSETVFIRRAEGANAFAMRILTPQTELPFAGHPTIGAALCLRARGEATDGLVFHLQAGETPVAFEGARAFLTAPAAPSRLAIECDRATAAALLGLAPEDVIEVAGVEAGVAFTAAALASRAALARAELSSPVWRERFAASPAPQIYAYFAETPERLHSRMFAPAFGIEEDPATGGAAVAMAALLPPGRYEIRQGEDMGRPSRLELIAGDPVRLGGAAVRIGAGALVAPEN
ncbi:MAG: PhzF family phenazine biosynthesis protein [Parvularculaceae bacterium]